MAKMMRLVGNELRKQFGRVITWILLVLLVLVATGSVGITLFGMLIEYASDSGVFFGESAQSYFESNRAYYQAEIDKASPDTPAEDLFYWQSEVESYNILIEYGIESWDDWRYLSGAVSTAAQAKLMGDSATYNTLLEAIRENDTDAYYTWQKQEYAALYIGQQLKNYEWAMDYCIENDVLPSSYDDWRYGQILTLLDNQDIVLRQEMLMESGGAWSEETLENARNSAAIAKYQLEHNIKANPADSFGGSLLDVLLGGTGMKETSKFWDAMSTSVSMISVVGGMILVMAGISVANEFSAGTIKFLLISPVKRWKILLSKYMAVLLMGLGMMVILFVCTWVPALLLGPLDAFAPSIAASGGEIKLSSPYFTLFSEYALSALSVILMASLAFALSALTRSSAVAIGISMAFYLIGDLASLLLMAFGFDWGRWLLFSNLDFVAIANGTSIFPHQSLPLSILIVVAHLAVFLLTAHDAFTRREV